MEESFSPVGGVLKDYYGKAASEWEWEEIYCVRKAVGVAGL